MFVSFSCLKIVLAADVVFWRMNVSNILEKAKKVPKKMI